MTYWPTIIKEVINWFTFLNIMDYTANKIYNEIKLLPSLLEKTSMSQMCFCYNKEPDDKNDVKIVAIWCSNCGRETGLSMKNINTNYKDITTSFVLNAVLHHVVMSWIIETHKQLKYDMDKHNINWITCGSWYNTSICEKLHRTAFEKYVRNALSERYNLMC